MRVLIVTSGSTGDVAPYTGLGARLRDAGHEVTLCTHEPFRALTELPFEPLPGGVHDLLGKARGQDGRTSGTDLRALTHLLRLARPLVARLGEGIVAAVDAVRPDAMLLSTIVAPLGYQVAEARGIPCAGVFLQPVAPTREFSSTLFGGHTFGRTLNLAGGHLLWAAARLMYGAPVAALRARLGLPPVPLSRLQAESVRRFRTFHGYSPALLPRPADWPPNLSVDGFWWPERQPGWEPPAALTDFLAAGPKPVFVGFGSMAPGRGGDFATPVADAVQGFRAVIQAGWSGLVAEGNKDVLNIGPVPHDWLFPRMSAVVHHAGAGTTAAALRAGVPAVTVPILADQPFWARRVHELGAGPPPLPLRHLTAARLAKALRDATGNPHYAARAQAIAARLGAEDSVTPVLKWIETATR